jgi:hypothetical protein
VLGVDSVPTHQTTKSNKGSHLQFFRYGGESLPDGRDIVEFAKRMFWRDGVHFYIDLIWREGCWEGGVGRSGGGYVRAVSWACVGCFSTGHGKKRKQ